MIFPWQETTWQQVLQFKNAGRFPHALLLQGEAGIGKHAFAKQVVRLQLCQSQTCCSDQIAVQCHACRLLAGNVHPDLLWVAPEKADLAIKIAQVRELNEFIQQTPIENKARIAVIQSANQLNHHAANALLKTLEEPPRDAILILVATNINLLPATIRSRCQNVNLAKPTFTDGEKWLTEQIADDAVASTLLLQLADGAPLKAFAMHAEDYLKERELILNIVKKISAAQLVNHADKLKDSAPLLIVNCLLSMIVDSLRMSLNADASIQNRDQLIELKRLATMPQKMQALLHYFQQLRKELSRGIAINKQLVIENILLRWVEVNHVSS